MLFTFRHIKNVGIESPKGFSGVLRGSQGFSGVLRGSQGFSGVQGFWGSGVGSREFFE